MNQQKQVTITKQKNPLRVEQGKRLVEYTVIIRLSPGGLIQNSTIKGGLIREGALIQKEAFLRGDLFETHYVLKEANANFWRVRRTVDYYFHQLDHVCWKMDW